MPLAVAVTVSCVSPGAASELAVTANLSQETGTPGKKPETEKQGPRVPAVLFGATETLFGETVTPGGRFVTVKVTGPLKFCCSTISTPRTAGDWPLTSTVSGLPAVIGPPGKKPRNGVSTRLPEVVVTKIWALLSRLPLVARKDIVAVSGGALALAETGKMADWPAFTVWLACGVLRKPESPKKAATMVTGPVKLPEGFTVTLAFTGEPPGWTRSGVAGEEAEAGFTLIWNVPVAMEKKANAPVTGKPSIDALIWTPSCVPGATLGEAATVTVTEPPILTRAVGGVTVNPATGWKVKSTAPTKPGAPPTDTCNGIEPPGGIRALVLKLAMGLSVRVTCGTT